MTITSYLPGRVRVRDQSLTNHRRASELHAILTLLPGVRSVSVNHRSGSMLVTYDPQHPMERQLRELLNATDGTPGSTVTNRRTIHRPPKKRTGYAPSKRKLLNYGMMITMVLTGAGAALHMKKLHALAGFLFMGIAGLHMVDKQNTLFV